VRRHLASSGVLPALIAAVALVGGCGGDTSADPTTTGTRAAPVKASADALRKVASVVDHPVYWVAGQTPATYELTQTADGRIYIRYLPKGVALGDSRPNFLTVGTYPQTDAFAAVRKASTQPSAFVADLPGGGLMVSQKATPTSVFFATPMSRVLVEVFDPTANRAANLITSGAVQPIATRQ
jgi:hypothetical protein